jgi:hypothetical protein
VGNGLLCTSACHIEGNIIAQNDWGGAFVGGGTVLGNTIIGNGGPGLVANTSRVGYANNILDYNNKGKAAVSGTRLHPMHPNTCDNDGSCP